MILNLDKLKASGEIPADLDAKIQQIMRLGRVCFTQPELREFDDGEPYTFCRNCGAYNVYEDPHTRIPHPYSSDLTASEELLGWLLSAPEVRVMFASDGQQGLEISIESWDDSAKDSFALITFAALSDKPLALAIAVDRLFGGEK